MTRAISSFGLVATDLFETHTLQTAKLPACEGGRTLSPAAFKENCAIHAMLLAHEIRREVGLIRLVGGYRHPHCLFTQLQRTQYGRTPSEMLTINRRRLFTLNSRSIGQNGL